MKYESFLKRMKTYKKISKNMDKLYEAGVDLFEGKYSISYEVEELFEFSMSPFYTKEGLDWISWFIFESEWGKRDWGRLENRIYPASNEKGEPIAYDLKSLYDLLESEYKKKRNEVQEETKETI